MAVMTDTFDEAIGFITEALDELLAAQALVNTDDPPPGPCSKKLNEAATTLQRAVGRLIIMTGEANRAAVEKARARGERCCALCWKWRPEAELERHEIELSTKKAIAEGRKTSWVQCREACK